MKTLKRITVLLIFSLYLINIANAQDQSLIELQIKDKANIPTFIIFKEAGKSFKKGQEKDVFKEYLKLTGNDELKKLRTSTDELGFTHEKYQQYYKGIKVEFAKYNVHLKDGKIESINGNFKRISKIKITPGISEEIALQKALDYVGASDYMWEVAEMEEWIKQENNDPDATLYPKAELVIVENRFDNGEMCLAYKFNIYANDPFSHDYIYVDAVNGIIVNLEPIIIQFDEPEDNADTRYSGAKHIDTYYNDGYYRLRDYSSTSGNGTEVWNMNNSLGFDNVTDFKDDDNQWTDGEYNNLQKDNAALDALWAAQKTYDYFWETFGRNSFDDLGSVIKCYVHWHVNYDRAAWDSYSKHLLIGDGGVKFDALTAIDVIAHEIGHGFNNSESQLSSIGMPGALKEGLGDIWGACVENYAAPSEKETWISGEDIAKNGYGIRSLINPNILGNPDTYGGTYWVSQVGCEPDNTNDYCGIHTNNTVISHWFYLLSEGGTDTNDNGDYYNVTGIGIEDASKIVYRMETEYLEAPDGFHEARIFALKSARDKFGFNSTQVIQTGRAWHAVGVGDFDFIPTVVDSQIRGGSDYVPYYSANSFFITPASDTLTSSYVWSIIPYTMGCSSAVLPHFTGSNTGTSVIVNHGSCSGTYLLRCEARNYWCATYYQDRVINVYNPNGGDDPEDPDPEDPDPCDPIMTIYPNPGEKHGTTTLKIQPPPDEDPCDEYPEAYSLVENEIKLYDLSGNLLLQESFSSDTYSFKNSNFKNNDIYIITIKDKKGKLHQKRLIIR